MNSALFLQSETVDPYAFYARMLDKNPIHWDEISNCWLLYSHDTCKWILTDRNAIVPDVNPGNRSVFNEYALLILNNLVRLANGERHEIARDCTLLLFEQMNRVEIGDVLSRMPVFNDKKTQIDWVNDVCKIAPVAYLLESFGFRRHDHEYITSHIEALTKLMTPARTVEQVTIINSIAEPVYEMIGEHLVNSGFMKTINDRISREERSADSDFLSLCVANLLGLLIQSYDAGRGLLSNSLLQIVRNDANISPENIGREYIKKSVVEVLRFDPPVQNTRRAAIIEMVVGDKVIRNGDSIVLMIAAANRDPSKFKDPQSYDINRANNKEHLTFGHGPHACVANHFSLVLASETLEFLFTKYNKVKCLTNTIEYEPLINLRLPKEMIISLK
jgi:cytochrome P450